MAYIAPDSIIRICKNVPLNNTYQDTFYFTNKTDQFSYFLSKAKYTVSEYSYQRQQKKLMVGITADNLYDCNYLVYRNNAFGDKYFYAFITDVEYISNEVSAISFELDVLQTWHFDYNLSQCFVEREHSRTDNFGENLIPENLDVGEYVYDKETVVGETFIGNPLVAFFCSFDPVTFDKSPEPFYNGLYPFGCSVITFGTSNIAEIKTFLSNVADKNLTDGIIGGVVIPQSAFNTGWKNGNVTKLEWEVPFRNKESEGIAGRVIKNKKLFTYPYNFLYVTNNEGVTANFPYEYFPTFKCKFNVYVPVSTSPECALVPISFKELGKENYNEKLTVSGFPQVAYVTDSFKAWLAQNAGSTALTAFGGAFQFVGGAIATVASEGAASAATIPAMVGGLTTIAGALTKTKVAEAMPNQARGSAASSLNLSIGKKGFDFYNVHIRAEYVDIIDGYFSAYGYATHKIKVPDRTSRPEWNYVKTVGCKILGSVPAPDMHKIVTIYDSGITFWHNPEHIGLYDLDNSPTGG